MNTSQINKEAAIITSILRSRKVMAWVDVTPERKPVFLETPSTIVYKLRIDETTPIKKVYEMQPDFCSHIEDWRKDNIDLPDDFQTVVRVDIGTQTIEVNRIDPQVVAFNDVFPTWKAEPMTALCGFTYSRKGAIPIVWRLNSPDQPHALIAGTTGSGKTNELVSIMASLALHNSPADLQFSIIDMKMSQDIRPFDLLPHTLNIAREPADALRMLRKFRADMDDRYRGRQSSTVRRVLVIDEMATLTESAIRKEVFVELDEIGRKCREANMNLIACTQSPKAKVLGDQLKGLLALRLVGAVTSKVEANVAVSVAGSGAEMLPGKGAMIHCVAGKLRRFQAPLVSSPMALVRKAKMKWEDVAPIAVQAPVQRHVDAIPTPQVEQPVTVVAVVNQAQIDADKIRQAWQDDMTQADMIRVMLGRPGDKSVNTGGGNRTRLFEAIKVLEGEEKTATTTTTTKKASFPTNRPPKNDIFLRNAISSRGKGILQ